MNFSRNIGSNSTNRNGSFSNSLSGPISNVFGQRSPMDRRTMQNIGNHVSHYNVAQSMFNSNCDVNVSPFLDKSEFPSLTNRNTTSTSDNSNHLSSQRPYVGMVKQPTNEPNEFTMSSEDFPALPGVHSREVLSPASSSTLNVNSNTNTNEKLYSTSTSTNLANIGTNLVMNQNNNNNNNIINNNNSNNNNDIDEDTKLDLNLIANLSKLSLSKHQSKQLQLQSNSNENNTGITTFPDGRVINIPQSIITDQFGIIGLLTFIRAADADSALISYTLGQDLTSLGLQLNASDSLHPTFAGVWDNHVLKPFELEHNVPQEYLVGSSIKDKLLPIKLNRYKDDILFYLFYNCPGDLMQVAAALELYTREWRFHLEEHVWLTQVPGASIVEKTSTYERGTYYVFDPFTWRKMAREFVLEYNKLETR